MERYGCSRRGLSILKTVEFDWVENDDWETNLKNYINSIGALKLVDKYLLEGEDISWSSPTNYRAFFSTSTLLEFIFQSMFKEVGKSKITEAIFTALSAGHMDNVFIMRTMNMAFRHNSIPHNHQYLCDLLTPHIKTNSLWSYDIRQIMSINEKFPLPYIKSINDRITKKIAEEIFNIFDKSGGLLPLDTQNYLVDNNEYIRYWINEYQEQQTYPEKSIRDVFIF